MPSPNQFPACFWDLVSGLLDARSSHCVAASRLLLAAVLLAAALLCYTSRALATFLLEMGAHAMAGLPKPVDYLSPQQQRQLAVQQEQQEEEEGQRQEQRQRRPNNYWAFAPEEGEAEGAAGLLDVSPQPMRPAAAAAAVVARLAVPQLQQQHQQQGQPPQPQAPSRQASCNMDLPLSPAAAF